MTDPARRKAAQSGVSAKPGERRSQKMAQETYEPLEMEVIAFDGEDIITQSTGNDANGESMPIQ